MASLQKIEQLVEVPMDDRELKAVLGPKVKIMRYKDLNKYKTMKALLPKRNDAAIILYENAPRDGHWCCLTRSNGKIQFFDPYGEMPDRQLEYANYSRENVVGRGEQSIGRLLTTAGCPIQYNKFPYQKESADVSTCGRHCVVWIKEAENNGTLDGYHRKIMEACKINQMTPDEVVTALVPIDFPK